MRRLLAAGLAFLSAAALVLAGVAYWMSNTAMDTPRFVTVAAPVIDQPEVRAALATSVGDQLSGLVSLPVLAPIIQRQAATVLESSAFRTAWVASLTVAHREMVAALTGSDSAGAVSTSNGEVSVDLIAIVAQVLRELPPAATTLLGRGRPLDLPVLADPAQTRAAIGSYLGRPLPASFATVPIMSSATLDRTQTAVRLFTRSVGVLVVVGLALLAAALVVSPRRRQTFGIEALFVSGLTALAYLGLQGAGSAISDAVPRSAVSPAVAAVVKALFDTLRTPAAVICVAGVVVGVLAIFGGIARRVVPGSG
jgi:hypothetical protein